MSESYEKTLTEVSVAIRTMCNGDSLSPSELNKEIIRAANNLVMARAITEASNKLSQISIYYHEDQ